MTEERCMAKHGIEKRKIQVGDNLCHGPASMTFSKNLNL